VVFTFPQGAVNACGTGGPIASVKRVIGLPGERVEDRSGVLFINGKRLNEPYMKPGRRDHYSGAWRVPAGKYFLVGDNRQESCDSRYWGPVPQDLIIGKVRTVFRER